MHIDLRKGQVHFFVLISYRTTPGAGIWTHELLRLRIRGTPLRPFDGTQGAVWPGPDALQAPGVASDVLFELHPDGREQHAPDVWSSPLSDLVIAVGPAPHVYLQPTHLEEQRVWVEDDTGVVLSKDSQRPAQWQGKGCALKNPSTQKHSRVPGACLHQVIEATKADDALARG